MYIYIYIHTGGIYRYVHLQLPYNLKVNVTIYTYYIL